MVAFKSADNADFDSALNLMLAFSAEAKAEGQREMREACELRIQDEINLYNESGNNTGAGIALTLLHAIHALQLTLPQSAALPK